MTTRSFINSSRERERRRRREAGEGDENSSISSMKKRYKRYDEKSVGGILDHLHRACFRPAIPTHIQVEVAKKVGISRRALARGAGAIEIIKPLYDLIDAFHQMAYKMSDSVYEKIRGINETMKQAAEYAKEEYIHRVLDATNSVIERDVEGSLLKNQLKDAQKNIKALSDLTEIMYIIKNATNRIQRERPYLKGDLFEMEENLERDVKKLDQMEEVLKIVEAAERSILPKGMSSRVNVCLARTRRALLSSSACLLLAKPLTKLKSAIDPFNEEEVDKAVKEVNTTIDNYDTLQMSVSLSN